MQAGSHPVPQTVSLLMPAAAQHHLHTLQSQHLKTCWMTRHFPDACQTWATALYWFSSTITSTLFSSPEADMPPSTHRWVWAESRALGTCTSPPRKRNAPFSKVHFCLLIQSFYSGVSSLAHTSLAHLPKKFLRPSQWQVWLVWSIQAEDIYRRSMRCTQPDPNISSCFSCLIPNLPAHKIHSTTPILFSLIRYKEQGRTVWS